MEMKYLRDNKNTLANYMMEAKTVPVTVNRDLKPVIVHFLLKAAAMKGDICF